MTMYEGNIWEVQWASKPHESFRYAYVGAKTFQEAAEVANQHWGDMVRHVKQDTARVFIKS